MRRRLNKNRVRSSKARSSISGDASTGTKNDMKEEGGVSILGESFLIMFLLSVVILTGGGQPFLSKSVTFLFIGLYFLFRTPRFSPNTYLDIGFLLYMLGLLLQFLPMPSFLYPDWREQAETIGIDTGWLVAAQPIVALETGMMGIAGFMWLYAVSNALQNYEQRGLFLKLLAFFSALTAGGFIYGNAYDLTYPFAPESELFTYFPNRNQSVLLFVIGGTLALGFAIRAMPTRLAVSAFYLLLYFICFYAILKGTARSGILLMGLGSAVIVIKMMDRKRRIPLTLLSLGGICCLIIFLQVDDFATLRRMAELISLQSGSLGARGHIYPDGFMMAVSHFFHGAGLSHFQDVFPYFNSFPESEYVAIHPESDWLWLWSEMGIIGLAFPIFLSYAGFKILYRRRRRKRERTAILLSSVALLLIWVHSLIDVSMHRPGIMMMAGVLVACAIPKHFQKRIPLPAMFMKGAALVIVLLGAYGIYASATGGIFSYKQYRDEGRERARDLIDARNYQQLHAFASDWRETLPLHWRPYFYRGVSAFRNDENVVAERYWKKALYLAPQKHNIRFSIGSLWLLRTPSKTPELWAECLRLCPVPGYDPEKYRREFYARMARTSREVESGSKIMNRTTSLIKREFPELRIRYLRSIKNNAESIQQTMDELEASRNENYFSVEQKETLLRQLIRRNNAEAVLNYLREHPEIGEELWFMKASALAKLNKHKEASDHARKHFPKPALPNVQSISSQAQLSEAIIRFVEATRDHDWPKLLQAANQIQADLNSSPLYIRYWKALAYEAQGNYEKSWSAWEQYHKQLRENQKEDQNWHSK